MKITTHLLPAAADNKAVFDLAVVIDVLRASSVMAAALHSGARRVITCCDVDQARQIARDRVARPASGDNSTVGGPLLCGERRCLPIAGFDLGNSPSEYTAARVGNREVVLTTTNGTVAIESARRTDEMIVASFLNFTAVVDAIRSYQSIVLVCAGTDGRISADDVAMAGALINRCESEYQVTLGDDDSIVARQLWRSWFPDRSLPDPSRLASRLRETRGGQNLLRAGYQRDLETCAQIDQLSIIPRRRSLDPASFA